MRRAWLGGTRSGVPGQVFRPVFRPLRIPVIGAGEAPVSGAFCASFYQEVYVETSHVSPIINRVVKVPRKNDPEYGSTMIDDGGDMP